MDMFRLASVRERILGLVSGQEERAGKDSDHGEEHPVAQSAAGT
jgi:hypothetical protein